MVCDADVAIREDAGRAACTGQAADRAVLVPGYGTGGGWWWAGPVLVGMRCVVRCWQVVARRLRLRLRLRWDDGAWGDLRAGGLAAASGLVPGWDAEYWLVRVC